MRSFLKHTLLGTILLLMVCISNAQSDFEIRINSPLDEYTRDLILSPTGDCVGIVSVWMESGFFPNSSIYRVSQMGDTMSREITKIDTAISIQQIILANASPEQFLVCGVGLPIDSNSNHWFAYFAKLDESFNIIWEKKYKSLLGDINYYAGHMQLLKKIDGGYLHSGGSAPHHLLYLFEISEMGDSTAYRLFEADSAGEVGALTYNHDSSAYLFHTHFAHYSSSGPESQCIEVDFDLNQTKVMYYPRWFEGNMTAKILPDGNIISASSYFEPFTKGSDDYIAVYKLDSSMNELAECKFTHPDTNAQGGTVMLDYYNPSYIYAGGTHNHQLGTWIPGPTWIVIARMNENLEIEYEKYIGGDGAYLFQTLVATPDSGVMITAMWYDYSSQSYQHDVLILKLGYEDFMTTIYEESDIQIRSAIVYPNPGTNQLSIRTALRNTRFKLFDMQGKLVLNEAINQVMSTFDVSRLNKGIYAWQLHDGLNIIESEKWIKK